MGLLASLLLLSACTTTPTDPAAVGRGIHQQQLQALQQWSLQGRLNIRSADESQTVNINWEQDDQRYDILLSGSLGLGAVSIRGDEEQLMMEKGNQAPYYAENFGQLSQDYLGYAFPAEHLLYWVKGSPAPDSPHTNEFNTTGQLARLEQDGWDIQYDRYEDFHGLALPGRIRLQHPDYRLTFLISRWLTTPVQAPPDQVYPGQAEASP